MVQQIQNKVFLTGDIEHHFYPQTWYAAMIKSYFFVQ